MWHILERATSRYPRKIALGDTPERKEVLYMKIMVINGPNLNMLGIREPEIYGKDTLKDLECLVKNHCDKNDIDVSFVQSNHEGHLVDAIQEAYFQGFDGIVINPAAYTHTGIALLDALKAVNLPAVEVHLSKLEDREDFRQVSYVSKAAIATITGKHFQGYLEAIDLLLSHLRNK